MRRTTANYAAERDNAVRTPRRSDLAHRHRHLERTGYPHDVDIGVCRAMLPEAVQRSLEQGIHDEIVALGADLHPVAVAGRYQRAPDQRAQAQQVAAGE